MEPYLALDTSTSLGSIAVGRGDDVLAEIVLGVRSRQSESLLGAVDFALRSAGLRPADLHGVVVAGGPGSFTGVRIAAATAKGFVRALGVPLFAYSGLLALAALNAHGDDAVCALFDARRAEVYAACYRFPGSSRIDELYPPAARPLAAVLEETRDLRPLFVGEGALRYRQMISDAGGTIAPAHLAVPRAAALLWLAAVDPERGRVASPRDWEPAYLRASGAQRSASR